MLKRKLDAKIIEQLELKLVEQPNGNLKLKLRQKNFQNQNFQKIDRQQQNSSFKMGRPKKKKKKVNNKA
jgi:hypothetical protein